MGALDGRVAVVTGASRGIGRAIATAYAKAGARVAGCGRGQREGDFLDELTTDMRDHSLFLACDVRAEPDVHALRATVAAKLGDVDILVNNAGIVVRSLAEDLPLATWNDVLASNLTGTFLVTQAFLPSMKARASGRIINIASIAGRSGTPLLSAYCAAKHGVVGLTRSLAEELRGHGIAVNAICPGSVDTEMLQQGMPGAIPKMTADEIARVALFLASEAPLALTGGCVDVFG